ncbi:MAG TPA: zinc ribbon domain-containing protein [candidate division Zixibacteria bacterium]|nr:zinc ribbon domain-containing protein [candidate division Zixibacteria bacterium]
MEDRFCPNCGTEVDQDARFCPACGHALAFDEGSPTEHVAGVAPPAPDEVEIPPAPAWPEPEPADTVEAEPAPEPEAEPEAASEEAEPEPAPELEPASEPDAVTRFADDQPTRPAEPAGTQPEHPLEAEEAPGPYEPAAPAASAPDEPTGSVEPDFEERRAIPPPPLSPLAGTTHAPRGDAAPDTRRWPAGVRSGPEGAGPGGPATGQAGGVPGDQATTGSRGADLPFTWPTTLGGWLIGAGSLVGAILLIPLLDAVLNVLLFLALLGVAATVFLADRIPDIPRLRLITLAIVLVALGVALDRAAFVVRGIESLFLVAMLAAAAGVLLVELDRDRPLPPPSRPGFDGT